MSKSSVSSEPVDLIGGKPNDGERGIMTSETLGGLQLATPSIVPVTEKALKVAADILAQNSAGESESSPSRNNNSYEGNEIWYLTVELLQKT